MKMNSVTYICVYTYEYTYEVYMCICIYRYMHKHLTIWINSIYVCKYIYMQSIYVDIYASYIYVSKGNVGVFCIVLKIFLLS